MLELWARTRMDWSFAATGLAAAVRSERWLSSHERREILETVYGMVRQIRRVEFALESSGARLSAGSQRDLARYLAYRLLSGTIDADQARAELSHVDWVAVSCVDERIGHERHEARRFALANSLPDWLARRLLAEYGEEARALATSLNERAPLVLRANTLKTTREALLDRLVSEGVEARPGELSRGAIVLQGHLDVFSLAAYREGLFEVQDEGSQLIADLVEPPERGIVIDACAGAGGKTLALGAAMGGKGRLLAVDIDRRKLDELRERARHAGLSSVQALHAAPDAWPREVSLLRGRADRVLVDAPCTGTGSLRRNPEIRWRLAAEDVGHFAKEQESLVRRALELVAPGGRVVYATCSLLREENEAVVERVLVGSAQFSLVPIKDLWGERSGGFADPRGAFLQTLPHRHRTDGFFAAVLRRNSA